MFKEQLDRIRLKLPLAAQADRECEVFGASSHRYKLNPPLHRADLQKFEQTHGIILPESYAAFMTGIGNGGAGPYYGILPLGTNQTMELDRLHQPSSIQSTSLMEGDIEAADNTVMADTDEMSDTEYDEYIARMTQGLLNIGEQGCSYETMLVVTGELRGKVIYMDLESHQTFITYEETFLDWYERWLDETIAGYNSSWFGMTRGGDDWALMQLYASATREDIRLEALKGMFKLPVIHDDTAEFLLRLCQENSGEISYNALQLLAKSRFDEAEPVIRRWLQEPDHAAWLPAVQSIQWSMPEGMYSFEQELLALLPQIEDIETFRFAGYILTAAGTDMLPSVLPFFTHPEKDFRVQSIYQAGKSPVQTKSEHVADFIRALRDPESFVQLTALQALHGVTEACLLEVYEELLVQHPTNEGYIRSNVTHRLKEFWFASLEELEQEVPASLYQVTAELRKELNNRA